MVKSYHPHFISFICLFFGGFTLNNNYSDDDSDHLYHLCQSFHYVPDISSSCFTRISSLNAHSNPMRRMWLLLLLSLPSPSAFKDEEGTERFRHLLCSLWLWTLSSLPPCYTASQKPNISTL